MNRLQKKCVIGTVGIHLLLLLILMVGPAFFNREPKLDNSQILDVIPANLVDAAVNSGVQSAQPPPPAPVTMPRPVQPLQSIPLPPKIVTPPPTPTPTPTPSLLTRVENYFKPTPTVTPNVTPAQRQTKPRPDNSIKVDTTPVKRTTPKNTSHPDNSRAINNTVRSLSHTLSSATKIDMPGNSSAAYANYGDVVISVYHSAWAPPDGMVGDNVTVMFKVTIARDGTVISAHIVTPSGDANVDAAVQRMLDRVTFIAAFPEGSDDKQRTYPVEFNATRNSE
jgi:TonB family protein